MDRLYKYSYAAFSLRYNLLLREILQRTPKDNPDYETIPKVMDTLAGYLAQMNTETGKCENIFNLQQIEERLLFKSALDYVVMDTKKSSRRMSSPLTMPRFLGFGTPRPSATGYSSGPHETEGKQLVGGV
jgi:hypothetical protein